MTIGSDDYLRDRGRPGTPAIPGSSHEDLLRLVNGVIWPGFSGLTLPEWLDGALHDGLAGVVYFSQNIDPADPAQLARLSASVREANPLAVIGSDEEGGNVTRLESRLGSSIPGAAVLGRIATPVSPKPPAALSGTCAGTRESTWSWHP
jgi:beta-glucosidase-like glycosyl hydrolase